MQSAPLSSRSFQNSVVAGNASHFFADDFDQDALSGRYGNSRDRKVPHKLREARSKPRQWSASMVNKGKLPQGMEARH